MYHNRQASDAINQLAWPWSLLANASGRVDFLRSPITAMYQYLMYHNWILWEVH